MHDIIIIYHIKYKYFASFLWTAGLYQESQTNDPTLIGLTHENIPQITLVIKTITITIDIIIVHFRD